MNDSLFCSIHVDTALPRNATASLVAELTGGAVVRGGVDCAWPASRLWPRWLGPSNPTCAGSMM
jgi:hypothetical protein